MKNHLIKNAFVIKDFMHFLFYKGIKIAINAANAI